MAKVLVIEDDDFISEELSAWLTKERHSVDISATADDALYRLKHFDYDIAIIDWNLPDLEGIEICKDMRATNPNLPLLMLTSRGHLADKIKGLDSGALDYMVKPCSLAELSARIRSLIRRSSETKVEIISAFDLEIQPEGRKVLCSGNAVNLSATEFDILLLLAKWNRQDPLDYRRIAHALNRDAEEIHDTLRTHIKNLRQKLKKCDARTTVEFHNNGYILSGLDEQNA